MWLVVGFGFWLSMCLLDFLVLRGLVFWVVCFWFCGWLLFDFGGFVVFACFCISTDFAVCGFVRCGGLVCVSFGCGIEHGLFVRLCVCIDLLGLSFGFLVFCWFWFYWCGVFC